MSGLSDLTQLLTEKLDTAIISLIEKNQEITLEIAPENLLHVAQQLRDDSDLAFAVLIDLCGVDYSQYGLAEWTTNKATSTGYDRAVLREQPIRATISPEPRFAVVYHLLSYQHNYRLRVRVFLTNEPLLLPSVISIWPSSNWYEREAFDLFGILFADHPDLRRILTDYGFIGHPFRKDFPLIGHVEVRYDATRNCVVYEPVDIQPRTLVPRTIRHDNRYLATEDKLHG